MKRKIDATDGTTYIYEFGDGTRVKLTAGKDGVTEDMICQLKRMDNRAYEKDLDAAGRKPTQEEIKEFEDAHPGEKASRIWNASLDHVSEAGLEAERRLYKEMVREEEDPDEIERLHELTAQMPPRRRTVLALYFAGYTQTEIARKMGLSTSTVRDHMEAAKKTIKKNFQDPQNL